MLFNLYYGPIIGFLLGSFIVFIYMAYGEKFILYFSRSRYLRDEGLVNRVMNLCIHCEVEGVYVYASDYFCNNVYYASSFWGKPVIIIGTNVYRNFSKNELNALIYASLLKLNNSEAKYRTLAGLIFMTAFSPVHLIYNWVKSKTVNPVTLFIFKVFLYPSYYLRSLLHENNSLIKKFDQKVILFVGLKKDYISSLYKISALSGNLDSSIGELILSELAVVKNNSIDMLSYLILNEMGVQERTQHLM